MARIPHRFRKMKYGIGRSMTRKARFAALKFYRSFTHAYQPVDMKPWWMKLMDSEPQYNAGVGNVATINYQPSDRA